ncbi:MAG: putative periplasmic or secreted lipoprotein [Parcubacteria group bacterium Gr01-1014_38]|nr:MAG: putative periplasmic or secreted lipoprotein [Parcubacteria group bacterium Gr01-1014_38]
MAKLAPVHWKTFEKFLFYVGCEFKRQKGDHRIYWSPGLKRPVVVPTDTQVPIFVIRSNLRTLGMSPQQYLEILERL